ncbi:MAG: hypothetical protein ABSG68_26985 [Thermoguttaceae bacterium]|jgi:hypothetical protein
MAFLAHDDTLRGRIGSRHIGGLSVEVACDDQTQRHLRAGKGSGLSVDPFPRWKSRFAKSSGFEPERDGRIAPAIGSARQKAAARAYQDVATGAAADALADRRDAHPEVPCGGERGPCGVFGPRPTPRTPRASEAA